MKWPVLLLLLTICAARVPSQHVPGQTNSPKRVMEEYWKMETNGGRLTEEGWNSANELAAQSVPWPQHIKIVLIHDDSSIWEPVIKDHSANIIIGLRKAGELDSYLHYTRTPASYVKEEESSSILSSLTSVPAG